MNARTLLPFLAVLPLAACGSSEQAQDATSPAARADLAAGAAYFATTCTPCHGELGLGDGAAAAALNPKPRNLADKAWQDTVEDSYLRKIILEGGSALGKSPLMPPNPQLKDKEEALKGLIAHLRSLAQ